MVKSSMPSYQNPYGESRRWLRGNIHAHTCCGPYRDLAESGGIYAALGYGFLAVTDHNKTHDAGQIERWSREAGLVVVPGVENGMTDHIIELGVHELQETASDDYAERARDFRERGGFIIGCHPQEYAHGAESIRRGAKSLHAVEIYNGLREARGTDESANLRLWDELLTEGARLWAVASDDFHFQYITPGHGWIQVQVPEEAEVSWKLLVDQMKRGAFYASTYPAFERLTLEEGLLHVMTIQGNTRIRVIGPGGKALAEGEGGELRWPVVSGLTYFRVEAISGSKIAWSQPFYGS